MGRLKQMWIETPHSELQTFEEPNSGPQILQGHPLTHQSLFHLHSSSYSTSHLLRPSNSFLLQISVLILVEFKKTLKTLQIQLAVPVKTSADVKANVCLTPGTSERMVGSVPLHICLTLVQTCTQFKFSWAIMRGGGPGNSCQHQASPCLSLIFHGPALSSLFKTITVTFIREKGISVRFRRKT